MSKLGLKIRNFTSEVDNIRGEIKSLNISLKDKILTFIVSLFIPLILFSGLIAFTINMFIYYDLYLLFVLIAYVLAIIVSYLTNYLYLVGITKKQVEGIKKLCLENFIMYSITLFFVFLMVFIGGY